MKKLLSVKVFLFLQAVCSLIFLFMIINLNILPQKYFMIVVAIIVFLFAISFLLQIKAKKRA